jgi:small-conductance mechanosensitive channel
MVQVLAFVMMMLALAVFSLSQSASKHAVEVIAKAVNADVKPNDNIKQMTQAVMDRLRRLKSADSTTEASKPPEISAEAPAVPADAANDPRSEKIVGMRFSGQRSRDNQTPVQTPPDAPRITVNFEDRSFRIAQERAQSMAKFVDENKVVERAQNVIINAYAYSGDGALSEARRLAYYRAMTARKQLVDDKVRPDSIRINVYDTADKEKGSTVEMIVATGGGAH